MIKSLMVEVDKAVKARAISAIEKKKASSMQSLPRERGRYRVLRCATHRDRQGFQDVFERLQQHILAELKTADRVDEKC